MKFLIVVDMQNDFISGSLGSEDAINIVPRVVEKVKSYQGKVIIVYGKNGRKFYKTDGKKPKRALQLAFTSKKASIQRILQNILKGLK